MSLKDVLFVGNEKMVVGGVVKALSLYSVSVVEDHNVGLASLRDKVFSVLVDSFPREDSNLLFIGFCRRLYHTLPIISYSLSQSEDFIAKCYEKGVSSFVFKTQELADLVRAVDYFAGLNHK